LLEAFEAAEEAVAALLMTVVAVPKLLVLRPTLVPATGIVVDGQIPATTSL